MKPYSLTRRLVLIVLLIELASALSVSGVALIYERHMHFRSFDILLRGRADSLLGSVQDSEDANDDIMLDGSELNLPSDDIFEVRDANGRVVGRSANWRGSDGLSDGRRSHDERSPSGSKNGSEETFYRTSLNREDYRVIKIGGLRVVDPGDKNGGIRRYVTVYYGSGVDRIWRAILRTVGFYAVSSLVVLAVTGLLMSWLLTRGLAPLRQLASTASAVSVTSWSFSPPENARMTLELNPLVVALETVLAGLERSFEKQKRFVGDAAHELKTGVAVVKSSIQLLAMKPRKQLEYQAGLQRCLDDCERMEELVARMLTLARVEETLLVPQREGVTDVQGAVLEVASELEPLAQIRDISMLLPVVGADEAKTMALIEPSQMKLLISNLLTNALQHSPDGSIIRVESKPIAGFAHIEISDKGDGIDAADLPTIFDRFSRSDPSRSRSTGGTGLGLAICKAIVERSKGTIEILSELNLGTTVIVRLPLAESKH